MALETDIAPQLTATVMIVERGRVLLILHKKFGKWLPPGGHLEPGEEPEAGALREAREETGLEVELVGPKPYLRSRYMVPATQHEPTHEHDDFLYVGRPCGGTPLANTDETDGMRWFTIEELEALPEGMLFPDTLEVVRRCLAS